MKALCTTLAAFALAGCIDLDHDYQINPDGSGKVKVRSIFTPFKLDLTAKEERSPEDQLKDAVRDELEKSTGVEAWSEVTWSRRADGKAEFKGTAYFKDLAKLKLHSQGFSGIPGAFALKKTPAGGLTLEEAPEEPTPAAAPPKLSDEEVKKKMTEERAQYQQGKAFLQGMLGDLKVRASFTFAGAVDSTSCFRKTGPSAAQIAFEGASLMKVFDALMMDDALLEKQIRAHGDLKGGPNPGAEFYEKFFGEKGPPRVSTSPGKAPLFDWAKEVAAAQEKQGALRKSLGALEATPPATQGGELKSVKVVGVRWVHATDAKRGLRPLNSMETGLTLALLAELPGAALSIKEGRLTRATSDAGEDLLPKRDWDRSLHFPQLTEDKAGVSFDVTLKLPGPAAKGLKEVSGTFTYLVGSMTKDVDLGFTELRAGTPGKELGAQIGDIEDEPFDKSQRLEVKLAASRETLAGLEFLDEAGKKLEVRTAGSMWSGKNTTLTYSMKGKFPAKGRIVAKVWQDLKPFEVPFSVKDVDLLGRPLK